MVLIFIAFPEKEQTLFLSLCSKIIYVLKLCATGDYDLVSVISVIKSSFSYENKFYIVKW